MNRLTIALDIMGGDHGPHIIFSAAKKALHIYPKLHFILCGPEPFCVKWLHKLPPSLQQRIQVQHCSEYISMEDTPSQAVRHKKDSSMRKAVDLVQSQQAQACVSAGNTGALIATACFVLKTLPGIDRPALISKIPNSDKGQVYFLDLGANVNCNPNVLFQYGLMGSVLAEQVGNINKPRVALLNVGVEDIKGNILVKQTAELLQQAEAINYIGYIEGNDIFGEKADVIVTDGFVGNVALKSWEGLANSVIRQIKNVSAQSTWNKILASIALPLLKGIYSKMKPDQYNGASLIGLRGIVVKSHGNASAEAFLYAIKQAIKEVEMQVPEKIKDKIEAVLMERHE